MSISKEIDWDPSYEIDTKPFGLIVKNTGLCHLMFFTCCPTEVGQDGWALTIISCNQVPLPFEKDLQY